MGSIEETFRAFASERGLQYHESLALEPLTPLLVEGSHGALAPAVRGALPGGAEGSLAHFSYTRNKTFRFNVVLTEVPESQAFVPRLFCIRRGRHTRDDQFYGFEARHSKLWTESEALSERYEVSTSPFQDENWMRQLFSPVFIDWLSEAEPQDFSFELAYGALLGSVEEDHPSRDGLDALCQATSHVAARIRGECGE